jgi:hypothetical protein
LRQLGQYQKLARTTIGRFSFAKSLKHTVCSKNNKAYLALCFFRDYLGQNKYLVKNLSINRKNIFIAKLGVKILCEEPLGYGYKRFWQGQNFTKLCNAELFKSKLDLIIEFLLFTIIIIYYLRQF